MEKSDLNITLLDAPCAAKGTRLPSAETADCNGAKRREIIVDVRFYPNGLVNTINHRPEELSAQEWFDQLCRSFPSSYRPHSGGRGVFRIQGDAFASIF